MSDFWEATAWIVAACILDAVLNVAFGHQNSTSSTLSSIAVYLAVRAKNEKRK